MKRSKLFLASTTALLAIVGIVSAKAHKAFNNRTYYTKVSCAKSESAFVSTKSTLSTQIVGYTAHNSCGKPVYSLPE